MTQKKTNTNAYIKEVVMKVYGLDELYSKFYSETEGDEKTKADVAAVSALKTYREQAQNVSRTGRET